jgi:hypothetical protein
MRPASRTLSGGRVLGLVAAALALLLASIRAFTLEELLADPRMDPKRFANRFEEFDFEYGRAVRSPEEFLASQAGDCDDYAILADYVLSRRHFTTRLVRVVMVGLPAHDICYVVESKAYLDYNNRVYVRNLQRSGPSLREIANRVADSFEGDWTSASEYTYNYEEDVKHFVFTVVKTDPPERDPDYGRYNKAPK